MRPFLRIRSAGSGEIISCALVVTSRAKQKINMVFAIRIRFIGFIYCIEQKDPYDLYVLPSSAAVATQREAAVYRYHLSRDVIVGFQ